MTVAASDPVRPRRNTSAVRRAFAPGVAAIVDNWRPLLLIEAAALALVVCYYEVEAVRRACERLTEFRRHAGLIFPVVSAALAGAILPELAKVIVVGDRRFDRSRWRDIGFALCLFAFSGVLGDYQYRVMAYIFGSDSHPRTVVTKMLVDQFITTPIYGTPYCVIAYQWRRNRYRPWQTIRQWTPRWYLHDVVPLLVTGWCFWIPMATLIYALPVPLQFCLFCLSLGAWSLLMVFVANKPRTVG